MTSLSMALNGLGIQLPGGVTVTPVRVWSPYHHHHVLFLFDLLALSLLSHVLFTWLYGVNSDLIHSA